MALLTTNTFDGVDGGLFPAPVYPQLLSAIIGSNSFANSLSRFDAGNGRAAFGIVDGVSGAAWTSEGDPLPDVSVTSSSMIAVAHQLGGIPMISNRAIRDTAVDLLVELQRVLRDYFSGVLDDGLLHGTGVAPQPQGLVDSASVADGDTLWSGVGAAMASLLAAGGRPTTLALSSDDYVAESMRLDGDQHPLYPEGLTRFAGLDVVTVPALDAGESLVYDKSGCFLVVGSDFAVQASTDYAPAYQRNSTALRTVGEFTVAVPVPARSIRRVTVIP